MACPDDHPDDKHGKEYCRAWCPKYNRIWSKWHYTNLEVDERCMCASDLPATIVLVRKPGKLFTLTLGARLFFCRLRMRFGVLRRMYMATLKHVIEAAIHQDFIEKLTQDRHDD